MQLHVASTLMIFLLFLHLYCCVENNQTFAICSKAFCVFLRRIANFIYSANWNYAKLRCSLQKGISASIKCHFFLRTVRLLRMPAVSCVQISVLRCRNNAIPRCTIYVRMHPRTMHPRMYVKVGGFARARAPFFLHGCFSSPPSHAREAVYSWRH